jgi:hypothetical protein
VHTNSDEHTIESGGIASSLYLKIIIKIILQVQVNPYLIVQKIKKFSTEILHNNTGIFEYEGKLFSEIPQHHRI